VLDRVRHVLDGDVEEPVGDLLRRPAAAGALRDRLCEGVKFLAHDRGVERLVPVRPEDFRKELGIELADHHVAIGDGERASTTIGSRARIGAG
jgi:hypothetical protein